MKELEDTEKVAEKEAFAQELDEKTAALIEEAQAEMKQFAQGRVAEL